MAKTSFLLIPPELEAAYFSGLQPGDRFATSRIRVKNGIFSRKKIKGLTARSYLPAISAIWRTFSGGEKQSWKDVDPGSRPHGWRMFVADQAKRIKFGLSGTATPNELHQDVVGKILIEAPASEIKLRQPHPANYYVRRKIRGTKNQYNPVLVEEDFNLPLEMSVNYKADLVAEGGDPYARLYARIHHIYQGVNRETDLNLELDLSSPWATLSDTISSVIGDVVFYELFIHLHDVRGTVLLDDLIVTHDGSEWARDYRFRNMDQDFTRAFFQVPKHWTPEIISDGADFDSIYPVLSTWYNPSWQYRMKITIPNGKVEDDLVNYPVFLDLDVLNDAFFTHVKNGGADIRITKADGITELAREVVACDTTAKTGEVHFRADALSKDDDTEFYIYYGNSGANDYAVGATYGRNNVWNSSYKGVWHLKELSGLRIDSTENTNDLTDNNSVGNASAKIGIGADFGSPNSDKVLNKTTNLGILGNEALTISVWVKMNTEISAPDQDDFFGHSDDSANPNYISLRYRFTGANRELVISTGYQAGGNYTIDLGTANFYYLVIKRDSGNNCELFVNGVSRGTFGPAAQDVNANEFSIGRKAEGSAQFASAIIDEGRLCNIELSDSWIATEYNNQNDPSSFLNAGSEETN